MADNSKVSEESVSQVTRNHKFVRLRTWLALRQKTIALLLGSTVPQVSHWENGLTIPDETVQKASQVFEVPDTWFDDGIDSPPPVPLTLGAALQAKADEIASQKGTKVKVNKGSKTVSIEVPGYKIKVTVTPTGIAVDEDLEN